MNPRSNQGPWSHYLDSFHEERPAVTENLLGATTSALGNPYEWCVQATPVTEGAPVVDLGCGSGPMALHLTNWVGLDRSNAELRWATERQRCCVALGDVSKLAIRSQVSNVAVSTMTLQIVDSLTRALLESRRILAHPGTFVLLLPASFPLRLVDLAMYFRLQLSLRFVVHYPNSATLRRRRLAVLAQQCGFGIASDERQLFNYMLRDRSDIELLVHSLYLPGVSNARLDSTVETLERFVGTSIAIPLRRVVLRTAAR